MCEVEALAALMVAVAVVGLVISIEFFVSVSFMPKAELKLTSLLLTANKGLSCLR